MSDVAAASAAVETAPEPLLAVTAAFPRSMQIWIRAWLLKIVTIAYFWRRERWNPLPRDQWPTYTKLYAAVPEVTKEARVFIPRSYTAGDEPLPLLIDIHGGGFLIGHPALDDKANAIFSQQHGFVVVSIPYRLSPTWKFPTHTRDVAALIRAVLTDDSLPVDRSKVALIGYSAGGNLALSAVQLHDIHKEIQAIVGVYPSTDMATDGDMKLATRPSGGPPDMVRRMSEVFYNSYVPAGVNKRDPLMSPLYASQEKLPAKLFLAGCEYDMLCNEARLLAEKHAAFQPGEKKPTNGGDGWRKGGVRWELIKGESHGFDQVPGTGDEAQRRRQKAEKLYADIATWLHEEAFS